MKRYWIQVYRVEQPEGSEWVSIQTLDYHPEYLERLAALGVVQLKDGLIHTNDLRRLHKLARLRSCLGVNLSGASIILDLLDKVEELQEEIRRLQRNQ
ncbi:MAG: chaperone modulator CbpM [Bacillota bacterium]|nr:chaperone modulator CbpM [Bacillota bacterium]MDW7683628.1 chaperone modulator CbpM [Bacillota bacterium]